DALDPVLGLAAAEGPQLGSEPDEELGHLAARPARAPHVARFVQHDREQQSEHEQQRAYDTHARLPAFACLSNSLPRPYPSREQTREEHRKVPAVITAVASSVSPNSVHRRWKPPSLLGRSSHPIRYPSA